MMPMPRAPGGAGRWESTTRTLILVYCFQGDPLLVVCMIAPIESRMARQHRRPFNFIFYAFPLL